MKRLSIGSTIKGLRVKKCVTQDELAEFLGISTAAISKWENQIAYPDITLLPVLANYFDVTIDEIMGYKSELTEKEINLIIQQLNTLISEDINKVISLFEDYLKNYSSNYKLMVELSNISWMLLSKLDNEEKCISLIKKIIKSLNKIVNDTNDIVIKENTLVKLSSLYTRIEEYDKAKNCIKEIYKPSVNPDLLLPGIYINQDKFKEAEKLLQESFKKGLSESNSFCWQLGMLNLNKKNLNLGKAIEYFELSIKIGEIGINEVGSELSYVYLARAFMKKGQFKKSIEVLRSLLDKLIALEKEQNDKYLYLLDNEIDIENKYKAILALINSQLDCEEILKNKDFINIISKIEDKVSK